MYGIVPHSPKKVILESQTIVPHKVKVKVTSVMSDSLRPHGLYLTRILCTWDFLGKNPGEGSHYLTPGDFLT